MTGQIYIKTPFALNGDTTLIPQTDGSGAVNFDDGYGIKYEQDPNGTGLALNRANMNYLFNVITQDLQQYQQHGIPNFITTSDNGGSPFLYDERALVLYDAGAGVKMYWSLVAANNALPSDPAKWIEINPYNVAQSLASPAFTGTPTAPTPPANDNTTRLATTAFVANAIATVVKAQSTAAQTWNRTVKLYTFPHALGVIPKSAQLVFVCTAADGGYSIGDVVPLPSGQAQQQASADYGYQTKMTTTNIHLSVDTNHSLLIHEWNNQANFNPANSSWQIRYDLIG